MKPLVSILIPAFNAERTIEATIQSAISQTWHPKEIIVIDDGSTDKTAQVAQSFGTRIKLVSNSNQGASAARNKAFSLCSGDYIQWLDADDVLQSDKIERQLASLRPGDSKRILLSSPWASFFYRTRNAQFVRNSLWEDLTPVEWLLRKMNENLHMQTGTWLTSRELAEAAGPWDLRLLNDDDGEYFCRVLLASEGTRFTSDSGVFYRFVPSTRLSFIGGSNSKKDAMLLSLKLHIQYIRSLEDSVRVKKACVQYLQNWYITFYPERADIMLEMNRLAEELGGSLEEPQLRWKFAWMKPMFGWRTAKRAQFELPHMKASVLRTIDRAICRLESNRKSVPDVTLIDPHERTLESQSISTTLHVGEIQK